MPNPVVLAKEWKLPYPLDKLQVDAALLEGIVAVAIKTFRMQKFTSRYYSREKCTHRQRDTNKDTPGSAGCYGRKVWTAWTPRDLNKQQYTYTREEWARPINTGGDYKNTHEGNKRGKN